MILQHPQRDKKEMRVGTEETFGKYSNEKTKKEQIR